MGQNPCFWVKNRGFQISWIYWLFGTRLFRMYRIIVSKLNFYFRENFIPTLILIKNLIANSERSAFTCLVFWLLLLVSIWYKPWVTFVETNCRWRSIPSPWRRTWPPRSAPSERTRATCHAVFSPDPTIRCQFIQHFTCAFFIQRCFLQLFF